MSVTTVLKAIRLERDIQIGRHGYTHTHDDLHVNGELAVAAIPFIQAAYCQLTYDELQVYWPWEDPPFEPDPNRTKRELLIKAAALLTAEIERIDRASNAPRHDASAASLPNAEGSEKIGQPLSAEDRATVEQYLADVTCPVCHCPKHMHRPGFSADVPVSAKGSKG